MLDMTSDGHSGAVHQRRYFFSSGSAAAFFRHQRQVTSDNFFLVKKTAALQRCFLRKFSAAAATANKLLPRLFSIYIFTRYRSEFLQIFFFALLVLPHYFRITNKQCYFCDVLSRGGRCAK